MRHLVRPGECVASLAAKCGVSIESIWNDPANATLRQKRDSPFMLCAGDEIEIPDPPPGGASVSPGGTHSLRGPVATVRLHLKLCDESWDRETVQGSKQDAGDGVAWSAPDLVAPPQLEPLANVAYRLEVGGRVIEGTTDGDGVLDEPIDARVTAAKLVLEPDTERERSLDVRLGLLDPPDEDEGMFQRLANLGFRGASAEDGWRVVCAFQKSRDLDVTGELDDATRQRLVDESGG